MENLLQLKNKAVLLVGAGPCISRSTALALGQAGCRLVLADIDIAQAEKLATELGDLGISAKAIAVDACDTDSATAAVSEAVELLGGLDVLVNVVGASTWVPLLDMPLDVWERDQQLNLQQQFVIAQAVGKQMVAQNQKPNSSGSPDNQPLRGGCILCIASVSGMFSATRHAAYGAAKAGLMSLVKTMAEEWQQYGIRINAIAPGGVRTERFQMLLDTGQTNPDAITLGRMVEPDEIAKAVLFMTSSMASGISGQTLVVDKGSSTANPFGLS